MESSGHRKTQRATGTWEPERNRSTHTQNVKLGETRPSVLEAQMASDPQRLKLDFWLSAPSCSLLQPTP